MPTPPTPMRVTTRSWRSSAATCWASQLAADERRAWGRQRRAVPSSDGQRREERSEVGVHDLPQALRLGEVPQAVRCRRRRARRPSRRPTRTSDGGDVRDEDLAAVADGHDPRRPVDRAPAVVATDALDLAGVDAHPHGQPQRRELALGGHRGVDGGRRRRRTPRRCRHRAWRTPRRRRPSPPLAARRSGGRRGRPSPATAPTARVEPSMSVNRNVTVARPDGRRRTAGAGGSPPASSAIRIGTPPAVATASTSFCSRATNS